MMNNYNSTLIQLVDELISVTSHEKINWEAIGKNSFRYITSGTSVVVTQFYDNKSVDSMGVGISIYNAEDCLHEYIPLSFIDKDDLEKKLCTLYSLIEKSKFNKFVKVVDGVINNLKVIENK